MLGGKDNFAADRAAADEIVKHLPTLPVSMRANRDFMLRMTRYLVAEVGMIAPGVTKVTEWRPDEPVDPEDPVPHMYGGVAVKR